MNSKILILTYILTLTSMISVCSAQNKLTHNQILNAVRTHQEQVDSIHMHVGDSIICDSTTTKIILEVLNDSIANNYSYRLTFTKEQIEVDVYDDNHYLYRSVFEYRNSSYEKLKSYINKRNIKKIDSYDDTYGGKENDILRLYNGNIVYMSIESYNGRTNVTNGFHELVNEIKKMAPSIQSVISVCDAYEMSDDSISLDTSIFMTLSETSLKYKAKGGEFKKINVTCNTDDWEILEYPDWVRISRNNNNDIIVESLPNDSKKGREGVLKIGCIGLIKEVSIKQM